MSREAVPDLFESGEVIADKYRIERIRTATQNVEEHEVVEARTIDPSGRVAGLARYRVWP